MGIASIFEGASSGHLRNCSFWYLRIGFSSQAGAWLRWVFSQTISQLYLMSLQHVVMNLALTPQHQKPYLTMQMYVFSSAHQCIKGRANHFGCDSSFQSCVFNFWWRAGLTFWFTFGSRVDALNYLCLHLYEAFQCCAGGAAVPPIAVYHIYRLMMRFACKRFQLN